MLAALIDDGRDLPDEVSTLISNPRMNKGLWQIAASGVLTLAAVIAALRWPEQAVAIGVAWAAVLVMSVLLFERRLPVNYKSLRLSDTQLEYVSLTGAVHVIPFHGITRIEFVREDAAFPCVDGPYPETKWMIHTGGDARIEVMDESAHRSQLVRAFSNYLPGFNAATASAAVSAREEGVWLCYSSH